MLVTKLKSKARSLGIYTLVAVILLTGCNANPHPDMPDLIPMKDGTGQLAAEFYFDNSGAARLRNVRILNFGAATNQDFGVQVDFTGGDGIQYSGQQPALLNGIQAGQTLQVKLPDGTDIVMPPDCLTSGCTVTITVDPQRQINEGIESNNSTQIQIQIPG